MNQKILEILYFFHTYKKHKIENLFCNSNDLTK